ncbi:MAG: YjbH domain-containing protein [Candidatus Aegiribacteria sp.]|nr:YjbH domain-containing protein [Candidatus Aegiribacteria sp.]
MKFVLILVLIAGIAVSVSNAGSLPFSRSGLIDTPTATVLQHTQITIGGSLTAFSYELADSTSESDFAIGGHLEIGLFNRAQIGATWLGDAGISGNVRVLVFSERINTPALAVGCQNIIGEKNYEYFKDSDDSLYQYEEDQNFAAYIVMTKNLEYIFGVPVEVNLGYGIGRFKQGEYADSDGISNPIRGLFGALSIHPAHNVSIIVEWDGRDANLGVSYTMNRNVRFMAAAAELEQLSRGSERNRMDVMQNVKFSIGVEFTIGPFINRTTLEPFEQLRQDEDSELLQQLEEIRSHAKEDIDEFEDDIP